LAKAKRGDVYLRTLVIHGARSMLHCAAPRPHADQLWHIQVTQRGNCNIAAVALVNKNVRTIWALLAHNQTYEPLLSKATFYNWKAEYSGLTVS